MNALTGSSTDYIKYFKWDPRRVFQFIFNNADDSGHELDHVSYKAHDGSVIYLKKKQYTGGFPTTYECADEKGNTTMSFMLVLQDTTRIGRISTNPTDPTLSNLWCLTDPNGLDVLILFTKKNSDPRWTLTNTITYDTIADLEAMACIEDGQKRRDIYYNCQFIINVDETNGFVTKCRLLQFGTGDAVVVRNAFDSHYALDGYYSLSPALCHSQNPTLFDISTTQRSIPDTVIMSLPSRT